MKKNRVMLFEFCLILISGIFIGSNFNMAPRQTIMPLDDGIKTDLESSVLGDVENSFGLGFTPRDITYLSGAIWIAASGEAKVYQVNPSTGATITSINVSFNVSGLTTDGTYLYMSLEEAGSGNGKIAKYHPDGTYISEFYIPLNDGYLQGLTWDGSYLWASQWNPHRALRINATSGEIDRNISSGFPFVGLAWRENLLWGVDNNDNIIRAIDPLTGDTREVFDAPYTVGEYGLAYDGTHFFFTAWGNSRLYILTIPTDLGEVWNQHPSPNGSPLDLAWNGTHYFLADNTIHQIYVLDDGTFEVINYINVSYEIYGLVVINGHLYAGQYASPYTIHEYDFALTSTANITTSTARYYSFDYDGTKLWAAGHLNNYIYELDPVTFSVIASHAGQLNYMGITYDSYHDVFWATANGQDSIYQLDPITFQQTGLIIDSPTGNGDLGLKYNGEHLILTEFGVDTIYKIINTDQIAPWFEEVPTLNVVSWDGTINLTFRLHDNYNGGLYRITSNSSFSKAWTAWNDGSPITELVSGIGSGTWRFTVEYTDSYDNQGTTFVFIKTIEEAPANNNVPGFPFYILLLATITGLLFLVKRIRPVLGKKRNP